MLIHAAVGSGGGTGLPSAMRGVEHLSSGGITLLGAAEVDVSWREQAQPGVVVLVDAPRERQRLARDLGHHVADAVALRAAGADLKVIAAKQDVAIATVHERVAAGLQRIRRIVKRRGLCATSLEPILVGLVEGR